MTANTNTTEQVTVSINVPLPAELHRKLRIRAIQEDLTLRDAVIAAIEEYTA